jgi:predicted MFS family arabinose efflux permease
MSLSRGIGNLIGMPFAYAVGRRIVFLVSTITIIIGAILCAEARSYEWHLASRMVLGLAAGQSEALVPMITQVCMSLNVRTSSSLIFTSGDLLSP